MKAIIQHNFTSGLGDFIVGMYEYLELSKTLKNKGYIIDLIINLEKNIYIDKNNKNNFFKFFNEDLLKKYFNNIKITDKAITNLKIDDIKWYYSCCCDRPGIHLWDLYIENENDVKNIIPRFNYNDIISIEYINIFSDYINNEYYKIKKEYDLIDNDYNSFYFRYDDFEELDKINDKLKEKLDKILSLNKKVFFCSNSFNFKKYLREFNNENIIMYNIPNEDIMGNHFHLYDLKFGNDTDLIHERTKFTIFDMLTLADSSCVTFVTSWTRASNFIFIAKLKKLNINISNFKD